ncbi:aspartate kinase [Lachnospiraceae bacterium XBB1006]|nr:aspartate kinase [Lachnospiraceae bacterium XBB1006]
MLIVKKFGGTSVGNTTRIRNVAERIAKEYRAGNDVIVVLSAMDQTTDELLALAKELNEQPPRREMDALLATGEQTSVALMAMALAAMSVPAISLNAFQVAMHSTATHMNARLLKIDTERLRHELESKKVVLVTGFQGLDKYGDVTTIGRGGSDTTAVAIAAAMHADSCEIYTDVDGVYTADPRIVPGAKKEVEITYDEMLELASIGAQVLHNRSVELAKKYGVTLVVRSSLNETEGTRVKEVTSVESMLVSGVAADKNAARITVLGVPDVPGSEFKIFDLLANNSINVDAILQTAAKEGKKDVSVLVAREFVEKAVRVLEENMPRLKGDGVDVDASVAKVSIVGASIQSNPGVASAMFEALYNVGINIKMTATNELRITVLVDENEMEKAVRAIHAALIE